MATPLPAKVRSLKALPEVLALAQAQFDEAFDYGIGERDPLQVSLPPYLHGAAGALLTPETLRMLGAMYLNAELEQAGVLLAAEVLTDARFELPLTNREAAQLLDAFDVHRRSAYTRPQRELLFARLFGIGGGALPARGAAVNHEFQRLLANFCHAILRAAEPLLPGGSAATRQALLRDSANVLAANLSARQFGNTVTAGRLLQTYTQRAVTLLTHPGMLSHFRAQGLWDLLPRLFSTGVPDLGRIVTRGQGGMRVLLFLASALAALSAQPPQAVPQPTTADATAAAQWLQASGLVGLH
jgi:hypothetical protein